MRNANESTLRLAATLLLVSASFSCANGTSPANRESGEELAVGRTSHLDSVRQASACDDACRDFPQSDLAANGFVFRVRVAGPTDGEAVLLLHGFPEGSYEWRFQMQALVGAGYRVVAPDQRGYSPGARPEATSDYALPNTIVDAIAIVDALGIDRLHVVGHDWGAAVAWGLALAIPDRVLSLTSVSIPAPAAFAAVLADKSSCQYQASSYFDLFAAPNAEDLFLLGNGLVLGFGYAELSEDARCEYMSALDNKSALHSVFNWYRANIENRQLVGAAQQPPVTVPTMLVWGDRDPFICNAGIDATGAFVHAPYRLEVLHGVDHWVPELAADRVSLLLLEHLAAHSR